MNIATHQSINDRIKQREEHLTKEIQGLAHEFEMLAIKLRKISGISTMYDQYDYINEHEYEFTANILVQANLTANHKMQLYIQKTFKRWQLIRQRINEIDPDFFLSLEEKIAKKMSNEICKQIDQKILNDLNTLW